MRQLLLPPIVTLLLLVLMVLAHGYYGGTSVLPAEVRWLGLLPAALGLFIAIWHARLFGRIGANIQTFGEPSVLTERGLFSYSRNPMYLGMFILLLGAAWTLCSPIALAGPALFFAIANLWYIAFEERQMRSKFGGEYDAYARKVRRWL